MHSCLVSLFMCIGWRFNKCSLFVVTFTVAIQSCYEPVDVTLASLQQSKLFIFLISNAEHRSQQESFSSELWTACLSDTSNLTAMGRAYNLFYILLTTGIAAIIILSEWQQKLGEQNSPQLYSNHPVVEIEFEQPKLAWYCRLLLQLYWQGNQIRHRMVS